MHSLQLCSPLQPEDYVPQPVVDVSPPKWHLAHATWFFETFILQRRPDYRPFNPHYNYLFNSYYEIQGRRVPRAERGFLSRPTVAEILAYRQHVDDAMTALLQARDFSGGVEALIELGLQHEQQHQELLLTDIKYILGHNPLHPHYMTGERDDFPAREHVAAEGARGEGASRPAADAWLAFEGGPAVVGHGGGGFAFDNESPRHSVELAPFRLREHLVTNGEYRDFIEDGGYRRFEFWHSEGFDWITKNRIAAPLYWRRDPAGGRRRLHYTLGGLRELPPEAPVTHVSYYEAHAFCQWANWRLPTEFEWEALASRLSWGQRWEWTESAYLPYPRFRKNEGAVGEYNGKFMINQMVLRGASFATPPGHARPTYRNFFHPPLRWQYTGIRPAKN